jgi:hypothetical protein
LRWVIVVVTASLCLAEEFAHLERLPSVGARFRVPGNGLAGLCMVSPGQMDKCSRVEVAGVQYTVAYRKKGLGKPIVTYLHTSDPKFVSPAGHRVGDLIQVDHGRIVRAPGFEIYADQPVDGWTTVVGFNGKVISSANQQEVELDSLQKAGDSIRLRISGFTAR